MRSFLSFFIFCHLGSVFSQQNGQYIDGVAAVIENSILLKSDLVQMINMVVIQQRIDPSNNPDAFIKLQESVLQSMVDQKIVLEMAAVDSITVEEKEVNKSLDQQIQTLISQSGSEEQAEKMLGQSIRSFRREFWFDMQDRMISERYQQQLLNNISATREDVVGFFKTYQDSIPTFPLKAKLRHLFVKIVPSDSSKKETIKLLSKIRKNIIAGEAFGDLAEKHSMDPGSKRNGGDLGWVKRGSLVKNFETAAFTLDIGYISQPIETEFGYHIIETLEKKGEKVHVRHILIMPDITQKDNETARNFALSLKDSALTLDKFKNLVKKHSKDDQTASLGGDLGWINPNTYPVKEIGQAIKYVEIDQCSPPINASLGFHLLWLEGVKPGGRPNLKDHWSEMEAMALNKKKMDWYNNWLIAARKKFFVKVLSN